MYEVCDQDHTALSSLTSLYLQSIQCQIFHEEAGGHISDVGSTLGGVGCIDPDNSLEAVVREAIEKPVDDILRSDLEEVAKPNTYGNIFL